MLPVAAVAPLPIATPLPSPPLLLLLLLILARVTFPCLFIQTEAKSFCYNAGASPRGPALVAARNSHLEPHLHPHPLHPLLSTSFYFDAASCCCCCCCACRRSKLRAINHFVCTLLHPFIQPERPMRRWVRAWTKASLSIAWCVCVWVCLGVCVCPPWAPKQDTVLYARASISCLGNIFGAHFAGAHKNHKTNTKQVNEKAKRVCARPQYTLWNYL